MKQYAFHAYAHEYACMHAAIYSLLDDFSGLQLGSCS